MCVEYVKIGNGSYGYKKEEPRRKPMNTNNYNIRLEAK